MKLAPAEWWVEDGQKLTKIRRAVTLEVGAGAWGHHVAAI